MDTSDDEFGLGGLTQTPSQNSGNVLNASFEIDLPSLEGTQDGIHVSLTQNDQDRPYTPIVEDISSDENIDSL